MTNGRKRLPAGQVLAAALPQKDGKENLRGAAAIIVDGEHPGLNGAGRRREIERWRRWLLRWVGGENRDKPVRWIKEERAKTLARYFPVSASALIRPELTEEDRRLREIQRLERRAKQLRAELDGT